MKLIKIGNRYINPEKVSIVYEHFTHFGDKEIRSTMIVVGGREDAYAMTGEDIESVVKKLTQEGASPCK